MTTLRMPRLQLSLSKHDSQSLLFALQSATTKSDVRRLLEKHGHEQVSSAWNQLDSLDKAALNLVRIFDGTLIHDDGSESHSSRNE